MASIEKYQEFLSDIKASTDISAENKKIILDILDTNEMQARIPNESLHELSESIKASAANTLLSPSSILSEVTIIQNRALKDEQSRLNNRTAVSGQEAAVAAGAVFITAAAIEAKAKEYGISEEAARGILEFQAAVNTVKERGSAETHEKQDKANLILLYGKDSVEYQKTIDNAIDNEEELTKDKTIKNLLGLLSKFGGPLANPAVLESDPAKLAQLIKAHKDAYTPEQLKQIQQVLDNIIIANSIDEKEFTLEKFKDARKEAYEDAAREKQEKVQVKQAGGDPSKVRKSILSDSIDIDNREETANDFRGYAEQYEDIFNKEKDSYAAESAKKVAEEARRLADEYTHNRINDNEIAETPPTIDYYSPQFFNEEKIAEVIVDGYVKTKQEDMPAVEVQRPDNFQPNLDDPAVDISMDMFGAMEVDSLVDEFDQGVTQKSNTDPIPSVEIDALARGETEAKKKEPDPKDVTAKAATDTGAKPIEEIAPKMKKVEIEESKEEKPNILQRITNGLKGLFNIFVKKQKTLPETTTHTTHEIEVSDSLKQLSQEELDKQKKVLEEALQTQSNPNKTKDDQEHDDYVQ